MSIARHEEPPTKPMKLPVAFGAESLSANRLTPTIDLIFPTTEYHILDLSIFCVLETTRPEDCQLSRPSGIELILGFVGWIKTLGTDEF